MKPSKLLLISLPLWLAACTGSAPTPEQHVHTSHAVTATSSASPIVTIKPGAAIGMSQTMPKSMSAGSFHRINLQFEEAYDEGDMQVHLETSPGLELFTGQADKLFTMNDTNLHTWPIDIKAEADGIYFISVFATLSDPKNNYESRRSFSARVDIGDITPDMIAIAFPENGTLSSDGKTRILPAVETVR